MKKGFIVGLVSLLVLGILYSAGIGYYAEKFQPNTKFGSIDISNLTLPQAEAKIQEDLQNKTVTIKENGQVIGTLNMKNLGGEVHADELLTAIYNSQNPNAWVTSVFAGNNYEDVLTSNVKIDDAALNQALLGMGLSNDNRQPTEDAHVAYDKGRGYYIQEESQGNALDLDKVKETVLGAIQSGQDEIEINTVYQQPEVRQDDERLQDFMNQINEAINTQITLTIAGNKVQIPSEKIGEWIYFNDQNEIVYDYDSIYEYLGGLNEQYATFLSTRQFHSTNQGVVSVQPGTLGWSIDRETETNNLIADLQKRENIEREPAIVGTGYGSSDDIGSTYIEIDLTYQMMYYYVNGELALSTPIVSGYAASTETVPGAYAIWNKESPSILVGTNQQRGNDYEQPVQYWLPFDDTGQGIHDANWQGSFGGDVFTYAGSQGCINTPPAVMAQLYNMVEVGTPVIIFH